MLKEEESRVVRKAPSLYCEGQQGPDEFPAVVLTQVVTQTWTFPTRCQVVWLEAINLESPSTGSPDGQM